MDLESEAETLARTAHGGQVDKSGMPYAEHPARVAARVHGGDARAAAWLHDVVEDTHVTFDDLRARGFPEQVVAAIDAVTKRAGEPSEDYYARVRSNELGLQVKLADLADNTDPVRMAQLDTATRERLTAKYAKARSMLTRQDN